MAITRWASRAVLTAAALAFALPFSTGTAQADPIIEVLADNNVNVTVGAYNNNVNSIPVSLGAGASLNTGSGITLDLDENEGIQLAMDIGQAGVWADASVGVPFTNISAGVSAAAEVDTPAVNVAVENAEVSVTADGGDVDVSVDIAAPPAAEPEVAAPPAPEVAAPPAPATAPVLESAVTITDTTAVVTDESKGDDDGECRKGRGDDDCPDDDEPSAGCPNITALGILSACLLPNLVQIHI